METDYTRLPIEVWVQIFSQLDAPSLASTQQTCRLFNEIVRQHDFTWSGACYPIQPRKGQSWKQLCQQLNHPKTRLRQEISQLKEFLHVRKIATTELNSRQFILPVIFVLWYSYSRYCKSVRSQLQGGALAGLGAFVIAFVRERNRRRAIAHYQQLCVDAKWTTLNKELNYSLPSFRQNPIELYLKRKVQALSKWDRNRDGQDVDFWNDRFLVFRQSTVTDFLGLEHAAPRRDLYHWPRVRIKSNTESAEIEKIREEYAMCRRNIYLLKAGMIKSSKESAEIEVACATLLTDWEAQSSHTENLAKGQISRLVSTYEGRKSQAMRDRLIAALLSELESAATGIKEVHFTPLTNLDRAFDRLAAVNGVL